MARKQDPLEKLIEAAMELAAERPWHEVGYREIVSAAGLRLDQAYELAPGKTAILDALARHCDRAVLSEPAAVEDGSVRDRLFDVLMRRFDALRPWRAGLASVVQSAARDPAALLCGAQSVGRSMRGMLLAAGLEPRGLAGIAQVKALSAVWIATLRDFLRDESEDLSPTMAALDGRLRRLESLIGRMPFRRRGRAAEDPLNEPPAPPAGEAAAGSP